MINIMLDLETWGTLPGDEPRSIGACVSDPLTGYVAAGHGAQPNDGFDGNTFYVALDNPGKTRDEVLTYTDTGGGNFDIAHDAMYPHYDATSEMYRRFNMRRDPQTVKWWSEQSDEAQAAFANPVPLDEGLKRFTLWLTHVTGGVSGPQDVRIWSHGANFDPGIIGAAFRAVGLPDPIHYRAPRDTRTIFDAASMDPVTCLDSYRHEGAVKHHALHDAIVQARAVCDAYRRLGLQDPLARQATPGTIIEGMASALRMYADDENWSDYQQEREAAHYDRSTGCLLGDDEGATARVVLGIGSDYDREVITRLTKYDKHP